MAGSKSADVFVTGHPTYLRYRWGVITEMAAVTSHGVNNPGSLLNVQWLDRTAHPHVPDEGTEVTCHCLRNGVLYVARGRVSTVGDGPQPRLRVEIDPLCAAMPLRKYERFEAFARLALIDEDQTLILEYRTPQQINISQGGFGFTSRPLGLKPGKVLGFSLELQHQQQLSDDSAELLRLSGNAIVRMFAEIKDSGSCYLGLQFDELSEELSGLLELWLAQHQTALRSV